VSGSDRRRTIIRTDDAPSPAGAYSQAVAVLQTVYCAGQVGLDPVTRQPAEGVADQTMRALENLDAVLRAAGGSLDDVVSVTAFLRHSADAPAFDAAYRERMAAILPARATVGVELPAPYLVEISAIAVIGAGAG